MNIDVLFLPLLAVAIKKSVKQAETINVGAYQLCTTLAFEMSEFLCILVVKKDFYLKYFK